MKKRLQWTMNSLLNSYGQVFFSDNKAFSAVLMAVTFVDFYTGLSGLTAVVVTTAMARWIGFDNYRINQGYYGFNSLLVGLGMGIYFQPGGLLLMMVVLAGVLTLFVAVAMEGIIGKYQLPHLSLPFVFSLWAIMLASREFHALGLSERGIYTLNELYLLGGHSLVRLYEWWGNLPLPPPLRTYLLSLGAIFFQFNMLTGVLVAIGLLVYSRIAFTLSLLGFFTAYLFYTLIGASLSEVSYSYIGFNYILSAIAIGGYFIIPNRSSYLWVVLLIPLVAILTISLSGLLWVYQLPIYSLPFNIMALLFLYALQFRQHNRIRLDTLFVQQNNPEKNLYAYTSFTERFGRHAEVPLSLPFFGEWSVTQGHEGPYTHKGDWRHAWDFEITDEEGKTYKGSGDHPTDYYCYDKAVLAPADGTIETVVDGVEDNPVGQKNLEQNWGNTIVIRHQDRLFTKLSHLKPHSVEVSPGERVKRGDVLARCGNSGHSPYPHLHFQVQRTPYIGSRTADYPFSHYMSHGGGRHELKTVAVPAAGDKVSNIEVHPALKKAFQFIPGERIHVKTTAGRPAEAAWEIKQDAWLNRYIECDRSRCRAWFRREEGMLYFTHFEGRRDNLLYYFYLGAYKVALGNYRQMELSDTFPANRVFSPGKLFLQDFIAPFYRYMKGHYHVRYDSLRDDFSETSLVLRSKAWTSVWGRSGPLAEVDLKVDRSGLTGFTVRTRKTTTEVLCTKSAS